MSEAALNTEFATHQKVQNIDLPITASIPDIHHLILDTFDAIIAPTITAPNPFQIQIKIFISRAVLSTTISQILLPLSNSLSKISLPELHILAIHAFHLAGIEL